MARFETIKDGEKFLNVIWRSKVLSKTFTNLHKMTYSKEHHVLTSSVLSLKTSAHYDTASSAYFSSQSSGKKKFRSRKKSNYKHVPHYLKPAHLVAKRNARERLRVQAVKSAFVRLSKHVPTDTRNKKLSKLKTLRLAISYIQSLQELIKQNDQLLTGNNYSTEIIESLNRRNNAHLVRAGKDCENFDLRHQDDSNSVTNANCIHEVCRKSTSNSDVFHLTNGSYENLECDFIKEVDVHRSLLDDQSLIKNHFNDYPSSGQNYFNVCCAANVADPQIEDRTEVDPQVEDRTEADPQVEDRTEVDPQVEDRTEADPQVEDRTEVISSVLETYVGEINCMLGKTMTTKCYLNEHSQHMVNNCVLSSCILYNKCMPCRKMADESLNFLA